MVSRRSVLAAATAVATASLGGCGILRTDISGPASDAATAIDGVISAQLEQTQGANFERLLHGTLALEASDRTTGLAIYDEAMRAIVTLIHDELDAPAASGMRVGGVSAVLRTDVELNPLDLGPEMRAANPRLDRVTAGSFYSRYGLG